MIDTVKCFGIVNKAEIVVFLELSCFFHDPTDVGNLISGSSAFSKSSLHIRKFTVHVLLKPGLENFEHFFTSMWDECNCVVVWAFFGIAFLWDWNEKLTFSSPVATRWVFQICWHIIFSFLFLKYKFNWRLITLQHCIGFAIHQHESATRIHMFPILNRPLTSLPVTILFLKCAPSNSAQ